MEKFLKNYGWVVASILVVFLLALAIFVNINKSLQNDENNTVTSKETKIERSSEINEKVNGTTIKEYRQPESDTLPEKGFTSEKNINEKNIEGKNLVEGGELVNEKPATQITSDGKSRSIEQDLIQEEDNTVSNETLSDSLSTGSELEDVLEGWSENSSDLGAKVDKFESQLKRSETQETEEYTIDEESLENSSTGTQKNAEDQEKVSKDTGDQLSTNPLNIDLMRVDETGEAILAGKAPPKTKIEVISNGKVIAATEADDSGNFVAMGNLGDNTEEKELTVRGATETNNSTFEKQDQNQIDGKSEQIDENKNEHIEWTLAEDIFVILPTKLNEISSETNLGSAVPTIVRIDSEEINIVQYRDIPTISEVTIDSISYSDLGEAVLVGRAKPNFKILVYLDNVLSGKSEVGASGGWRTELKGVAPGIYTLRLDEVDDQGIVQSRIETPFKKESNDILMNMVSGSITVQPGNSLWRIARRIFGKGIRYIEIYEKNISLIRDPDLIYPGQVFAIPTENM